ncbi:GGDEF domain-containing protein, partial [Zavarzinia sp.]|uniref:GGDEF domain-containing protein n=1 Tax=Zavarzinia sp. TaxID=2027920 RepID=UPI003BB7A65B
RLRGAVIDAMRGDGGPDRAIRVAAEASMGTLHGQGAIVVARHGNEGMRPILTLGAIDDDMVENLTIEVEHMAQKGQAAGRVEVRTLGERTALVAIASESGAAVGALVLVRSNRQHWHGTQAGILGAVADQLGLALGIRERVARLEEQSRIDALTGIMNRRAFQEDLPAKLRQADRLKRSGALLLMDLDAFKPLNDRFGHAGGDKALALLGTMFRERLRAGDLVARIGGDEFAFWLDGTDSAGAFSKAGHLFDMMAEFDRRLDLIGADLGFSLGIAVYEPGSRETVDALTRRADAALYRAKAGGRDRAEMALPSGVG